MKEKLFLFTFYNLLSAISNKIGLILVFTTLIFFLMELSANAEKNDTIKNFLQSADTSLITLKNNEPVFVIVEKMPVFHGGEGMMFKFISDNLVYPQSAREKGISGVVYTNFIVEKDGSLSDIHCLKDIGGGCCEECIRVLKIMPKWQPGKQAGKPVRVKFNLPVRFTLE